MKTGRIFRDVVPSDGTEGQPLHDTWEGRAYIAVIGIDRYRAWNRLYNAVSDAGAALTLFAGLGFDLVAQPLFDECATGDALRRLVVDDLSGLGENDSLILFFSGHGHTITRTVGGTSVRDGYLIPADGDRPGGRAGSWIRLESWLTDITRIPAKHILVILDACHSGIALGPILQWRSRGMENSRREPLEQLRVRRSRRIITSALDDQLAMDGGPVPGHSLFTGCLIEALAGGLVATRGYQVVTGSEIGHYVQRRVSEYPGSVQTPDFGALELDDRGELLVRIGRDRADSAYAASVEATIGNPISSSKLTTPREGLRDVVPTVLSSSSQPGTSLKSAVPQTDQATNALRRDRRMMLLASAATLVVVIAVLIILVGNGRNETARATPMGPTPPVPGLAPTGNAGEVVDEPMNAPADALEEPRPANNTNGSNDAAVRPHDDRPQASDASGVSQSVIPFPEQDSGDSTNPPRSEEPTTPKDADSTMVKPNSSDAGSATKHAESQAVPQTQPRTKKPWLECSRPARPVAAGASIHLTCQVFNTSDRPVRDVKYNVRAGIVSPARVDGPSELPAHFASDPFSVDVTAPVNADASELEVVVTLSAPNVRYDLRLSIMITDSARTSATNGSATNSR